MILSTVESDRSFLIWSCVYPAIGVLFGTWGFFTGAVHLIIVVFFF